MAKISLLIANYNNGKFFKDTFNSLLQQTESDWEAIIIDDCSTDNSLDIIQNLIAYDSRFKLYKNEKNLGYTKSIIKAIELSTAEIFGRLDPDDALVEDALERSLKVHNEFPECGLVYGKLWACDEQLNQRYIHENAKQVKEYDQNYWALNGEISAFSSFKKSIYYKTEGISPLFKRAQDTDIYMKMVEVAPVKFINRPLYLYRIHEKGVSSMGENKDKAAFWHWLAIIKAAERRGTPMSQVEAMFIKYNVRREEYERLNKFVSLIRNNFIYKTLRTFKRIFT